MIINALYIYIYYIYSIVYSRLCSTASPLSLCAVLAVVIFRERHRSKSDLVKKLCRQFISFVNFGTPEQEDKRPVLDRVLGNDEGLMNDFDREVGTV